MQLTVGFPLI